MEQHSLPATDTKEEISLKELILKFQQWWRYLLSKWLIIFIVGITCGALGLTYGWLQKPKYLAELTFVLEEGNKSGGLGAYAGIASQFGIDLGGMSGSSGVFAGDNIIEFLKSRLMVERALLSQVVANGKSMTLAEYYIDVTDMRAKWVKDAALKNLHFPLNQERATFTLKQDSILREMYNGLLMSNLVVEKVDKKLSFISVNCISGDEFFSKVFTEHLVKEATTFYVNTKTKRSKANVDLLQSKADSIEKLMYKKTYSAALSQDLNRNPGRSVASVETEVTTRDKIVLQTMYTEVVKNLELSKLSMAQETPLIQIVDTPILPLKKQKLGKFKGLVTGGILGGFLIVVFLILKRIYKDIMS